MSVNELNLGGEIKFADDYLAKAQAVPQNTTADGNGGVFENLGQTQGSLEIVVKVNTAIVITDTKVITVKVQDSADNLSFADYETLYTKTASGATTLAVGTELKRFIVPKTMKRYSKAVLVSNDAGVVGKVDIYLNYIPR